MTKLEMQLGENSYPIIIEKGILNNADKYLNLNRKCLIVTDKGVPKEYAKKIAYLCNDAKIVTVEEGENSKSPESLKHLLTEMCGFNMGRGDCAVAVGGGVVGDLTGFAAAIYMRGMDFYNIPTTLLSQVDSSIGGKTAINLGGIKNIVGAFKQPKAVLIDTTVLKTLPERQFASGLAEAIKMSLTSDKELFEDFQKWTLDDIRENIDDIILRSLKIKKSVVEEDEKESGLRKILNLGHTYGHGIEAEENLNGLYHGECVALGMLPMVSEEIRPLLISVFKKVGLPHEYKGSISAALEYAVHDKKCKDGMLSAIFVERIGSFIIKSMSVEDFKKYILSQY